MTYNRDLQEDKERLFDTSDTVRASLRVLAAMLDHTVIHEARCQTASADPALLATDLADYLVRQGLPFRQAHHVVGQVVALAEGKGVALDQLSLADFQGVHAAFGAEVRSIMDLKKAMGRRDLPGAPGTKQVARQLARWRRLLGLNQRANSPSSSSSS